MDKDLLKGLGCMIAFVALIGGVVVFGSDGGSDKAKCIARALKSHVEYANIDKTCGLSRH